jgi:hypothetical protein
MEESKNQPDTEISPSTPSSYVKANLEMNGFSGENIPETPLVLALKANENLTVSKWQKAMRKVKAVTRLTRPKLKRLNMAKKTRKQERHFMREFKGKVIQGEHELYILTAGMMHGMRVTLGGMNLRQGRDLLVDDFAEVLKLNFPPSGSSSGTLPTPPHGLQHTFKFKSYAPYVFSKIRDFYGIDKREYIMSICGDFNFVEFISNSKSGQFFFYSHDGRYMIKTQTKEENRFMKRILPHYYKYITENPHSFMVRIYGMQRVKMYHLRRNVHFVIMESVFNTPERIHTIYDLKGSSLGREATPKERENGGVLKDNDLRNDKLKLKLGPKKELFMEQIRKDAMFLASLNIMDYSLLVGIHYRSRRHNDKEEEDQMDHTMGKSSNLEVSEPSSVNETGSLSGQSKSDGSKTTGPGSDHIPSFGMAYTSEPQPQPKTSIASKTPFRRGSMPTILPSAVSSNSVPLKSSNDGSSMSMGSVPVSLIGSLDLAANGTAEPGNKRSSGRRPSRQTAIELDAMGDVYKIVNDMGRYGFDGQIATGNGTNDATKRPSWTNGQDDDDAGSDFDDGDSDVEAIEPIVKHVSSSIDIDDLMLHMNDENLGTRCDEASMPALLDTDADPMKNYYDLSVRLLQIGARRAKAKKEKAAVEEAAKRTGSTVSNMNVPTIPRYDTNDLDKEETGSGFQKKEGATAAKMLRAGDVKDTIGLVKRVSAKYNSAPENQKQLKLVKPTFGPGVTRRHPWTMRGDNGINARIYMDENEKDRDSGSEHDLNVIQEGDNNNNNNNNNDNDNNDDDINTRRDDEIYYVGIIDILQQYDMRKFGETIIKRMMYDLDTISSVDSFRYAKRFIKFMDENIV